VCGIAAIERYRSRLSGPLLDRIDLQVVVRPVSIEQLRGEAPGEPSAPMRARVEAARARQARRLARYGVRTNAQMAPAVMRATCRVTAEAEAVLARICRRRALTARAVDRLIKVGRTIADLRAEDVVSADCIREAAGFRALDDDPIVDPRVAMAAAPAPGREADQG